MPIHARIWFPIVIAMLGLATPAIAQDAPAPPRGDDVPEAARVLVTADPGARRPDLTARAAGRLRDGLVKAGVSVVSLEKARGLDRREGATEAEPTPAVRTGESAWAGVMVALDVGADRERKIQGRYRVELSARVKMTDLENATVLLESSVRARATAFEGYREAHAKALDDLGADLLKRVTARLEALRKEEREKGALFTIGVTTTGGDPSFPATFAERLQKIARVDPSTVTMARSLPDRSYREFRLRYRGRSHTLVRALHDAVQEHVKSAVGKDRVLEVDFTASTRRVMLTLRTRPVAPAGGLDEEVKRVADALVSQLLEARGKALAGKRLAVEPTSIPATAGPRAKLTAFARAFARSLEAAERKAAASGGGDPAPEALDSGPITIEGEEFTTLRQARVRLDKMEADHRASRAATLAADIARLVAAALEREKLRVLSSEADLTTVLDRIKREAALHRQEGAIDPETIALLNTRGAEALVLSWFRPFMKSYVFRVAVIDCQTGEEIAHRSRVLDRRFKDELDTIFAQ